MKVRYLAIGVLAIFIISVLLANPITNFAPTGMGNQENNTNQEKLLQNTSNKSTDEPGTGETTNTSLGTNQVNDKDPGGGGTNNTVRSVNSVAKAEELPTQRRYVNKYQSGDSPKWILEKNISLDTPESGTYEVTRYPYEEPTEDDFRTAWELYNRSYEVAKQNGWFDFEKAKEDGYKQYDARHYINKDYYLNEENLNPTQPESLVYYRNPENRSERVLAGFMYLTDSLQAEGEQVAGPLTVWHYHPISGGCFESTLSVGFEFEETNCSKESIKKKRGPEMMHVWFIRHPRGTFSSGMVVPEEYREEEPTKMSESEFKNYLKEKHDGGWSE